MNSEKEHSATCFSGGAIGADTAFDRCARRAGHKVINYSFKEHRTRLPRVILTNEQLKEAIPFVIEANEWLDRTYPSTDPFINKLLERDYFQVKDTERVYAVSEIGKNGFPKGGTAWAVTMAILLEKWEIYLYDQRLESWFGLFRAIKKPKYKLEWTEIMPPIRPFGLYTGIGTRKLLKLGELAINNLYKE